MERCFLETPGTSSVSWTAMSVTSKSIGIQVPLNRESGPCRCNTTLLQKPVIRTASPPTFCPVLNLVPVAQYPLQQLLGGHNQSHKTLCVGTDGNAEDVFCPSADVGDRLPASSDQVEARLRSIRHAAHPHRFEEVIKKVAAAHPHLRELGDTRRLRILIRPQVGKDRDIGHTRVIRVRIIRRTAVAGAAIP